MKRGLALCIFVLLLLSSFPAQAISNAFISINAVESTGGCNGTSFDPAVPILNVSYGWQDAFRVRQMTEIFAEGRLVYRWGAVLTPPEPSRVRENVSGWVAGYVVESFPSGTLMTVKITLEFDGVLGTSASADFYCDGSGIVRFSSGPDMGDLPLGSVVGSVLATGHAHWAPRADAVSDDVVIEANKTLWVVGIDEAGSYYKVMLSGRYFWLPVAVMGPNFDEVWNGTPLPTTVVY